MNYLKLGVVTFGIFLTAYLLGYSVGKESGYKRGWDESKAFHVGLLKAFGIQEDKKP